jgi:hypothetical protein
MQPQRPCRVRLLYDNYFENTRAIRPGERALMTGLRLLLFIEHKNTFRTT